MLILLALIVAIFALDGVECSSVTARKSQTQVSQKAWPYGNAPANCNCHCNLHHDLRVSEDIKELRARLEQLIALAPVVQKLDCAIHRINLYPVDNAIGFLNTHPLDSDLSVG